MLGAGGRTAGAAEWLGALLELSHRRYVDPYYVAVAYAGTGEPDRAFAALESVCRDASTSYGLLMTDPLFDTIRADRRFPAILARLGFPASPSSG